MRDERGVVARLCWMVGWVAAIVAGGGSRPQVASAIKLAGVPDPGWITTYGLPGGGRRSAQRRDRAGVGGARGVLRTRAQADGIFDISGCRAIRISAVASLVWVCALLGVPLAISRCGGGLSPGRSSQPT